MKFQDKFYDIIDHNKCPSSEKSSEKCILRNSYFHHSEPRYASFSPILSLLNNRTNYLKTLNRRKFLYFLKNDLMNSLIESSIKCSDQISLSMIQLLPWLATPASGVVSDWWLLGRFVVKCISQSLSLSSAE